jgi:hypothetical protein
MCISIAPSPLPPFLDAFPPTDGVAKGERLPHNAMGVPMHKKDMKIQLI